MDPGAPERLVRVDVPDPGHAALVEQERLDRRPAALRDPRQPCGAEGRSERLGPEARGEVRTEVPLVEELPGAEAANVAIRDLGAGVEEHGRAPVRVGGKVPGRCMAERARHPQVDDERPSAREAPQQVLAAPVDGRHGLSDQPVGDDRRVDRPRQARIDDLGTLDRGALEHGHEPTANGLDLGQLGHAAIVGTAPQAATHSAGQPPPGAPPVPYRHAIDQSRTRVCRLRADSARPAARSDDVRSRV